MIVNTIHHTHMSKALEIAHAYAQALLDGESVDERLDYVRVYESPYTAEYLQVYAAITAFQADTLSAQQKAQRAQTDAHDALWDVVNGPSYRAHLASRDDNWCVGL